MAEPPPDDLLVEEASETDEIIGATPPVTYDTDAVEPASGSAPDSDVGAGVGGAQELAAYLHALDVLIDVLDRGGEERQGSARRIARAVRLGPSADRFGELKQVATSVLESPDAELGPSVRALRAAVKQRLSEAEEDDKDGSDEAPPARVLVVDDDPVQARLMEAALRAPGRAVESVDSIAEGRARIEREEFALVIVDRLLGDGDGHELLMHVRSQAAFSNMPVIILSSRAEDADVSEAFALGADAYFSKAMSPRVLAAAVSSSLFRAAQRRQSVLRDPDTGVRTRTVFVEAYEHHANLCMRRGAPFTLAVLGIDRFRRLVDLHGTESGRRIITATSDALTSVVRGSDIVGRWGPDVLAVAFPDTDVEGGIVALRKVWDRLAREEVALDTGSSTVVTASAGVAGLWEAGGNTAEQVDVALRRLAQSRKAGRGRITSNDEEPLRASVPILLIEDDELTAELIEHRLDREGYEIIHYAHGADALAAAAELDVALAIVDVSMPGANGYEILLRLRQTPSWASVPILMMTQGPEAQTARAFRMGATDVLRKPFAPSELLARVNRLVSG